MARVIQMQLRQAAKSFLHYAQPCLLNTAWYQSLSVSIVWWTLDDAFLSISSYILVFRQPKFQGRLLDPGTSRLFPEPRYQKGVVPASIARFWHGQPDSAVPGRAVPDIAALADPSTGMLVNWNNEAAPGWPASDERVSQGPEDRVRLLDTELALHQKHTIETVLSAANAAATQDPRGKLAWPIIRAGGRFLIL